MPSSACRSTGTRSRGANTAQTICQPVAPPPFPALQRICQPVAHGHRFPNNHDNLIFIFETNDVTLDTTAKVTKSENTQPLYSAIKAAKKGLDTPKTRISMLKVTC